MICRRVCRILSPVVMLVALAATSLVSRGDDATWQAGLAKVKITPEERIFLAGYASRDKPFERVESDLFAKALALEDVSGARAVLVTSDLIGFRGDVAEKLCAKIKEKSGLERRQILLNSSHTHTGPVVSLDAEARGNMSAEDAQRVVAYTEQMLVKVADVVAAALADLKPARLSAGKGVATFVMNRREPTPRGVVLGVNPSGLADRGVPLLRIDSPDGKLRGVLFGAATHNTTLGGRDFFVCGDYAGFSQQYVEEKFPGAQAMFMLGCAGSSNPWPRGTLEVSRQHGATLGAEVCRLLDTELAPVAGPLTTELKQIDLPLQSAPSEERLKQLKSGRGWQPWVAQQMLDRIERGEKLPASYRAPLAVWQFGNDLTLVALPGEVVVDYVSLIEQALGPLKLWISAYNNDVFGYLPSAQVLREGGYETRGLIYGGIGFFSPDAEQVVADEVRKLAKKAGRE